MERARKRTGIIGLIILLVVVGCVRKEKEEKAKKPPEPSLAEKPAVVPPEVQQKVEALLAPARQRELTGPEKDDLLAAITELGKPGVACLTNELLKDDLDARKVVIEMLGKLRDASCVNAIGTQFKRRQEDVRLAAAKALGEIRDLKAAPALISALRGDKRKLVRAEAATSLGLLRAKDAVVPLVQALDPVKERKRWVRRSAAEALGLIGDVQAKEALMTALNDEEKVVRVAAMFGLYKLGDTKTLEFLEDHAKDPDEEVRQWAVRELGFIGASQSAAVLTEAMKDSAVTVRLAAADALGKIPADEALDTLVSGLLDRDETVRLALVDSLTTRGVPRSEQASKKLFDALADLIKNEPVDSIRKKARVLYDAIKPTLPSPPAAAPSESPATPPPSG